MAIKDLKTAPPHVELWGDQQTITADNIGGHQNYWPFFHPSTRIYGGGNVVDYRNTYPLGDITKAGLDQYKSCGWIRDFNPHPNVLYDPILGLSDSAVDIFLTTLDTWYSILNHEGNNLKVLWVIEGYKIGNTIWGTNETTVEYEIAYQGFLTALLTSTRTNPGGLGFTVASHPGLAAVEFGNEQIRVGMDFAAYARIARITSKLFAQYKPACQVFHLTSTGGNTDYMFSSLNGNAVSIQTPVSNGAVGSPPDDGTAKVGSAYIVDSGVVVGGVSHHYYGNVETFTKYNQQIANNRLGARHLDHNHSYVAVVFEGLTRYKTGQPLFGTPFKSIPFWNTETSILEAFDGSYKSSGSDTAFRWHRISRQERLEALIKWFLPTFFMTSNGTGGLGVSFIYNFDITSDSKGASGSISNMRENAGSFLIDVNDAPWNFISQHCYSVASTSGSPATLTWTGRSPLEGERFDFSGGTAPSGTALNTQYYAKNVVSNTCQFSATLGGPSINTASTGSGLVAHPSTYFEAVPIYVTAGASGWADVGLGAGESKWLECTNATPFINGISTLEIDGYSFTSVPVDAPIFSHSPLRCGPYPSEWHEFVSLITSGKVTFGWIHYSTTNTGIYIQIEGVGNYYTKEDGTLSSW